MSETTKNWQSLKRYVGILDKQIEEAQISLNQCRNLISSLQNEILQVEEEILKEQNFIVENSSLSSGGVMLSLGPFFKKKNEEKKSLFLLVEDQKAIERSIQSHIYELFIEKKKYTHILETIEEEIKKKKLAADQKKLDEWRRPEGK